MPFAAAMKPKSDAKGAPESLASSRPAKRQRSGPTTRRTRAAAAAEAAAAEAVQHTHSAAASTEQQDTTGSSELPLPAKASQRQQPRARAAAAEARGRAAARPIPPPAIIPSATPPPPEERSPPAKRQRVARAGIPPSLPHHLLRVTDRYSGPYQPDTEEGHFVYTIGDNLTPRFKIMRKFGEGTFGRVVECWDRRRSGYVAVKVIRAVEKYRDAAMVELQVLSTLAANDPGGRYPIVRLLEWFEYRGHVCMVFDRLGPSLYDCLRRNAYRGFPLPMARAFIRQVLEAVAYMHSFAMVHTDLKPENILFLDDETAEAPRPPGSKLAGRLPRRPAVRLIDFGSATFEDDYHSSVVSTRHYRAPEIILGLGWSHPCDLWSLGCILVELLTGDALFQTHENLEHLAMMEAVVGPMARRLAAGGAGGQNAAVRGLFKRGAALNWPEGAEGKRSLRAVAKMKPLAETLRAGADPSVGPHVPLIVDLVSRMMEWEPERRITAKEALRHPFFTADLGPEGE